MKKLFLILFISIGITGHSQNINITTTYDIEQAYNKCADTLIDLTKIYVGKYYGRITINTDSVAKSGVITIQDGSNETTYFGSYIELDNKDFHTNGNVYQWLIMDDSGVTMANILKEYVAGSLEKYGNKKYIFQVFIATDTKKCYLDFTTVQKHYK